MKYLFLLLLIICKIHGQEVKDVYEWSCKYQPLHNNVIGIWPSWITWADTLKLKELKNKYGFSHIVVYPDIQEFSSVKAVYGSNMLLAFYEGWYDKENKYDGLWGYYIDEPVRGNIDSLYMKKISLWVHNKKSKSLFLSGDYKRTDYLKQISLNYTDGILYTSYSNWNKFIAWWIPGSEDQRDSWRDMKIIFQEKYFMTWINAYSDTSSYDLLFQEARTLNLTGLWLYYAETEISNRTLDIFCDALVRQGYMGKVYGWIKKTIINGKVVDVDYYPGDN